MKPDTAEFLTAAAELSAITPSQLERPENKAKAAGFVQMYRAWIIHELGMSDAPNVWADRSSALLHLMAGGSTLDEAVEIHARFVRTVWDAHSRFELRDEGDAKALVFNQPTRPGPDGLVRALWPMSVTLSNLEFLAGGELSAAHARVPNARLLPASTTHLFFRRHVDYEASELALVIPRQELNRAVAVRASDIPAFLKDFMLSTIGAARGRAELRALVSTLIWNDKARNSDQSSEMSSIAERLGLSVATLRRKLREEGVTFRELREETLDQLAKVLLREQSRTIEQIAEQLGYSDTHAFRRAFGKRNGGPPRDYRRSGAAAGS